jgi:hypothetical protein
MNLIFSVFLLIFVCGRGYKELRNSNFASDFTCQMPANEIAMSKFHRNEKAGKYLCITFDISEMRRRVLVPYHKVFTTFTITNVRVKYVRVN